ncbi:MAG: C13 family peptidase [Burkholderiales bacterium]
MSRRKPCRAAVLALAVAGLQALACAAWAAGSDAVTPDGGRYYGPLVDGRLHGRGRIEWRNGARYEGEFADGLITGRGRLQFANGSVYEGEFRDGLMAGRGRLVVPERETYEGEFRQDMYWGRGELRYQNGNTYRGGFERYEFHGKGRFEYPNGDLFEGDFSKGEFTGNGRHARKDGSTYEGAFRNWQYHGPGRFTDSRGTVYEGSFVDGSLEGRGKVTGKGSVYEGELKSWQFHGRGVLRHGNGDVYEGSFQNGLYEGQGTLKYARPREDGRTEQSGVWRYGTLPDEKERRRILADTEAALYEQQRLLDKALASLKPSQPGRISLYLLAVAGDGTQEVFRREVEFVDKAFAERFGTAGRSVALVNSRNTLISAPMATVTSIRTALKAIGGRMNRDQDILFLFLTSHGSREHELSLTQRGMQLRGLPAAELGALLKESGIRWKVVVVSACYSGGFVDALNDGRTLVITAARRDRASFGCADENDFTYFGRAFFKEALPGSGSFSEAFLKAKVLVEQWERKDAAHAARPGDKAKSAEENRSLPQISSAAPIDAQLARWWAQLPSVSR